MNDSHNRTDLRLLSTRHACARADISKASLFRAARRGDLHPVHFGKRFTRWPLADLDAWIQRGAQRGDSGDTSPPRPCQVPDQIAGS